MSQITENAISVTPEARVVVLEALANEPGSESLALWIEVRGVEAGKFSYDLYFQSGADATDDDLVSEQQRLGSLLAAQDDDVFEGSDQEDDML